MTLRLVQIDVQVASQAREAQEYERERAAAFFSLISEVLPDQTGHRPCARAHGSDRLPLM